MIRRILGPDHPDLLVKFEQLLTRGPGNLIGRTDDTRDREGRYSSIHSNVMNTGIKEPVILTPSGQSKGLKQGNTSEYAVRRLTRERPDLVPRVESGELSLHGAMVAAEFRDKKIIIQKVRRRKNLCRNRGHSQYLTIVKLSGTG